MDPVSVGLNFISTGGAEFEVRYSGRPLVVLFPFPAADVSALRFDGGAAVLSCVCVNPSARTPAAAIGQQVRLALSKSTIEGRLIAVTDTEATVVTKDGVVTVRPALVETMTVLTRDEESKPQLHLAYETEELDLVVRGFDPTLSYSVHHSVVIEPSATRAGEAPATMNVSAQISHLYPWAIRADKITLTEVERLPEVRSYATVEYAAPGLASQPRAAPVAQSANTGSIKIERSVLIERAALGSTVVHVARLPLKNARMHFLATVDPTNDDAVEPMQIAVRLKPGNTRFVPSGPATVLIDMDPAAGAEHVAPIVLHTGFFHNAWDTKNQERGYHRLGPTMQVSVRQEDAGVNDTVNKDTGRTTHARRMAFSNTTPYPAQVKMWLMSNKILYSAKASDAKHMTIENMVDSYVRETAEDSVVANAHTLQVVVPPGSGASCLLTVVYANM